MTTDDGRVFNDAGDEIEMTPLSSGYSPMICGAPAEDVCRLPFGHDGMCSPYAPVDRTSKRPGIEIQIEPWHYRWDKPHNPRRCLLCLVERLAVKFGFAHHEED